ncbi:MAG: hypothetical protein LBV18_03295 [Alistipes sp.]|jgi:prefoldin subunit 5|nr:hypothetical protein [Alistipes sp.]
MKRFTLKSVSVIAAFFIGISVSNSCGESPGETKTENPITENPSTQELWAAIQALQSEVSGLKTVVAELETEASQHPADVAELETEMSGLKTVVVELESEVLLFKADVAELESTVSRLEDEVAALKSSNDDGGSTDSGEFLVDGLWFSRNGHVSSKTDRLFGDPDCVYEYDGYGRMKSYTYNYSSGNAIKYSYSYSDKTVIMTTTNTSNGNTTTSVAEYRYY